MVLSVPLKGGTIVTHMAYTPHLELLGLRSETRAIYGNPKYISSPFMDTLIYYEYVDVIYVADDPWIRYRSGGMLGRLMAGWPPWGYGVGLSMGR